MIKQDLVTVCIPTLNRPKIVERLLVSIKEQVYSPHKVLVIDASDNNDTKRICDENADNLSIEWIKSPIKGLTFQRNVGIDASKTKYILMLDDDIILDSFCIYRLVEFLEDYKNTSIAVVGANIVNEFGKSFYKYQKLYHKLGIYETLKPGKWLKCGDFLQNSFVSKNFEGFYPTQFCAGGATMFRRDVCLKIRPDSKFRFGGEDKHWTLRISQKHTVGILAEAKLIHEHHPSSRKRPIIQGRISVENLLIILRDCDPHLTIRRLIWFQFYWFLEINRQMAFNILYFKKNGYTRLIGSYIGWFVNLKRIIFK